MFRAAIFSLLTVLISGCAVLDTASTAIRWIDKAREAFSETVDVRSGPIALEEDPDIRKTLSCAEHRLEALVGFGAGEHARNATFHAMRDAAAAKQALSGGRHALARRKILDLDRNLAHIGEWMVFNDILTETALVGASASDACPLPQVATLPDVARNDADEG